MDSGSDASADRQNEDTPEEYVAGGVQRHPLAAAAVIGGAIAAGAGAWLGARALARRKSADIGTGKPASSVMQTAITACDVAASQTSRAPEPDVEIVEVVMTQI